MAVISLFRSVWVCENLWLILFSDPHLLFSYCDYCSRTKLLGILRQYLFREVSLFIGADFNKTNDSRMWMLFEDCKLTKILIEGDNYASALIGDL